MRRESPPARALKWRTPDCEVVFLLLPDCVWWREWHRPVNRTVLLIGMWLRTLHRNLYFYGCEQSIYRLLLCSKTVLLEYVSATGPRQKISTYVSVIHVHSQAAPCWIFNVCDVVVKQLLGLPRFQNLLLIVYDHINTICAIIKRLFRQNKFW